METKHTLCLSSA